MHLSLGYKNAGKFLYTLQLLIGFATIVCTVLATSTFSGEMDPELCTGFVFENLPLNISTLMSNKCITSSTQMNMYHSLFFLSLASGMVIFILNYYNPMQRWRQLRGCACAMESTIWKY